MAVPPRVDKQLIVRLDEPFCGEAHVDRLVRRWVTPLPDFFVIEHGDVPAIDGDDWTLELTGHVRRPLRLSLEELQAMRAVTVPATLMCAGNRRREHHAIRAIDDPVLWGAGAIGNARWTGVRLAEVLALAGVLPGAAHLWLDGLDRGGDGAFGGSIPLDRVREPDAPPVLLAYGMNGARLPRAHGFPLRAVVPGFIGARSVKWLGRIVVEARPSSNPYFVRDHRLEGRALQHLATYAVIGRRDAGAVEGYAIAADPGATITRVEISIDGGGAWRDAELHPRVVPSCWRHWRAELGVRRGARVVARATDSTGHVQPAQAAWNPGGYLYDGWSSIDV